MTSEQFQETVRARVRENPSVMPRALAEELGVAEAEVIRALPEDMRAAAPAGDFEAIWGAMCGWEKVTFIAVNPGIIVEVPCRLPKGRFAHGMFNLMDKASPLGGHILAHKVAQVWLVSKPFFGLESHSVQFFDAEGGILFSVYAGRDESRAVLDSVRAGFLTLRSRYETPAGGAQ
jgi:putative heme utilization carrier protein HutX